MKRRFTIVTILLVMLGIPGLAFGGGIKAVSSTSYSSTGDLISGWHWLRKPNAQSRWHFPAITVKPKKLAVCLSCLSTNGVNGGAGYDSRVIVGVEVDNKVKWYKRAVILRNTCPCIKYSANSNGIGYQSYGCMRIKVPLNKSFTIILKYPGSGHHTATNKASVKIVYVY